MIHKHAAIMMYYCFHSKFESNRKKCSDQFKVNKRDTDYFEHLYEESAKPMVNVKCLACLNFLIDLSFFMVFSEGKGGVTVVTELQ